MSNVIPFNYESQVVRVVTDEDGNLWWVAKDVCGVLGIENNRDAVSRLDDDERGVEKTDTPSGPQMMNVVNEFGLYSLVLRSNKPEARDFKRWIIHEVLPSIRKTGMYRSKKRRLPETLVPIAREFRSSVHINKDGSIRTLIAVKLWGVLYENWNCRFPEISTIRNSQMVCGRVA